MIRVFFNEDGYYVAGESVEISRRFHPATTERGDRIFQPIHHTYKILYNALCELRDLKIREDVIVFNDSRIIDEVNGYCEPLDEVCDQWLKIIRRHIIPSVRSVIFFRKKPMNFVGDAIESNCARMMPGIDPKAIDKIVEREQTNTQRRKKNAAARLRQLWFGDKYGKR